MAHRSKKLGHVQLQGFCSIPIPVVDVVDAAGFFSTLRPFGFAPFSHLVQVFDDLLESRVSGYLPIMTLLRTEESPR